MANELILIVRFLQVAAGLIIGYYSFRFYDITQPLGWKYLHYSSIILYIWPLASLLFYLFRPAQAFIVDGIGMPLFAIYLSITTIQLISEDLPVEIPSYVNMTSVTAYMAAVLASYTFIGTIIYQFTPPFFTLFYFATILLILPALYGVDRIPDYTRSSTGIALVFSTSFILIATLLNLYATYQCGIGGPFEIFGICDSYSLSFHSIHGLPLIRPFLTFSLLGPVFSLLAVAVFGYGILSVYYGLQRTVLNRGEKTPERQLILSAIETFGQIIGDKLASRIVSNTFEKHGITVRFVNDKLAVDLSELGDKNQFEQVKEILAEGFEGTIGPVGRRKVEDIADEIHEA